MHAFIARCLTGNPTAEDSQRLVYMLESDPFFRREYEFFQFAMQGPAAQPNSCEHQQDEYVSVKFRHITRRLIDEGSLEP
ncbi:MAG TPA: hypothetical protein VEB86_05475 [Chryseosolibacter sp.]|nr:hypothetical protein [Chryseosolibacter sp.]